MLLTDWTDEDPKRVFGKLKKQSDYYNRDRRNFGDFLRDVREQGFSNTVADRRGVGRACACRPPTWPTCRATPTRT